ncbi:MAG: hypothetical protein Q9163_006220 [Psora crenata]
MNSSTSASSTSSPITSQYARALLAGALAGTTVDLSLYPLDTLKTRLQSSAGFRASGGFRGVYAGVGSALIGSAPGAALFFVSYEGVKDALRRARRGKQEEEEEEQQQQQQRGGRGVWDSKAHEGAARWAAAGEESIEQMAAASAGEVAACAVRVPTEVVKQRAQALQQGRGGSLEVLQDILRQRRKIGAVRVWTELYRGWSITVLREVPFTVIQFPIWEALKEHRRRTTDAVTVSAVESGFFGSIAGAIAAGVTTPLDVLKTRMMLAREKENTWALARRVLRESGPRAFVAGMGPRVLWISIGGAVFLGSYQWAYNELGGNG